MSEPSKTVGPELLARLEIASNISFLLAEGRFDDERRQNLQKVMDAKLSEAAEIVACRLVRNAPDWPAQRG